jgi:hypothetical protein
MFDELTKTFDDEDKQSVKSVSSKGSRKSVKKEQTIIPLNPVIDETVIDETVIDETVIDETVNEEQEQELDDPSETKLNNNEPKKDFVDEYLIFILTSRKINWMEEYNYDDFRIRLREIPGDEKRTVKRAYRIIR